MNLKNKLKNFILLLIIFSIVGCASIGVGILPKTRVGFNGAMIFSEEQQLLLNLVRIQFEDRPFFLSVDSIQSSNSFSYSGFPNIGNLGGNTGSSGVNFGSLGEITSSAIGHNFNLTPSTGWSPSPSYGDSPSVSYTPLQGEKFTKQILSKLSIGTLFLLLNSGWNIDRVMRALAEQFADYDNVAVLSSRHIPNYRKFIEVVEYIQELYDEKIIYYTLGEVTSVSIN